jgi:predicted Fe-S protein YdhL (DUF1289 family)
MSEIETPCKNICMLDLQGQYCMGCYRTRQEVGEWMSLSDDQRAAVMDQLAARKEMLNSPK